MSAAAGRKSTGTEWRETGPSKEENHPLIHTERRIADEKTF